MEHFVTLFDYRFLPQGLALHASLKRNCTNFVLWILCVDERVFIALQKLSLSNVSLLDLSELETPELLSVKSTRTRGEYCWTLTPFAPRFVFEAAPYVTRVTYLDADLWFLQDPKLIFDEFELSKKSVLITKHGYAPEYDQTAESGRYCVQFIIFVRGNGERVRKWWEERCVEWCSSKPEDGKFGDQKYLDNWPQMFPNQVHVMKVESRALGPWNAARFPYSDAVFYHFHGLKIISERYLGISAYYIPRPVLRNVYAPYINELGLVKKALKSSAINWSPDFSQQDFSVTVLTWLRLVFQRWMPRIHLPIRKW